MVRGERLGAVASALALPLVFPAALDVVAQTAPTVTAVAITSTPKGDANSDDTPETYGGEAPIKVQLTFSAAVEVTATPTTKPSAED